VGVLAEQVFEKLLSVVVGASTPSAATVLAVYFLGLSLGGCCASFLLKRKVSPIAGYCIADDVTARDLQRREPQWTRAKGADTFCPFGPWITTSDEVPNPGDLGLRTWVNGELRQDSRTSDLIFGCQELVDFISQTNTLVPGDLILTGTPSGVGAAFDPPKFLQSGDVIRIEIERLGAIEHAVR